MISMFLPQPGPEQIARQLRRPFGFLGKKVGKKMNHGNEFLYDLTIDTMRLMDRESILEIGFANGMFFNRIFSKANQLTISGLDFSEAMFNEAIKNNKKAISSGRFDLKLGSSEKIPFSDNTFDKVFCINVIYFWDNPGTHVNEILRVLKPGGKFYTGIRAKESLLQLPFTTYGFIMYEAEEWKVVLEENGFLFDEVVKKTEPEIKLDGRNFQLESYCIVVEKRA